MWHDTSHNLCHIIFFFFFCVCEISTYIWSLITLNYIIKLKSQNIIIWCHMARLTWHKLCNMSYQVMSMSDLIKCESKIEYPIEIFYNSMTPIVVWKKFGDYLNIFLLFLSWEWWFIYFNIFEHSYLKLSLVFIFIKVFQF